MTVLITLTLAGTDVGPFDIYSDLDGFTTPVVTGVSRAALIAGYYATVPDGTTQVLVQSTGTCTTQLYLNVSGVPTTTTTTTALPSIVYLCVNNGGVYPYPVTAGNGTASGTLYNYSGSIIYVYGVFNSGGNSSGSISADSAYVNGFPISFSGTVTSSGQTIYSDNYVSLNPGDFVTWSLSKQDTLSSGATLRLGYATSIEGSITTIAENCVTPSTTSTTTTPPPTGTLTVSYSKYSSSFSLVASVPASQSIAISGSITANGYPSNTCVGSVAGATLNGNTLVLLPGNTTSSHVPTWTSGAWSTSLTAGITDVTIPISINGGISSSYGYGDTITVGSVTYTFFIVTECSTP